jgi:hypothetical protein
LSISGAHLVIESKKPDADRAFFRDILGFAYVDAGDGWLIFRLPKAEVALHPIDNNNNGKQHQELYLICDDLKKEMATLQSKGVKCSKVANARWGEITKIKLPGGSEIGLYQPRHPRP